MKLYTYYRSQASFRVRIALNLKGVARDDVYLHLEKGDQFAEAYRALNPQMVVPTLIDGDTKLFQSLAILEYLDEKYPEPPLLPPRSDIAARAWVRGLALINIADAHPLVVPRIRHYLTDELGLGQDQLLAWIGHWLAAGLAAMESLLGEHRESGRLLSRRHADDRRYRRRDPGHPGQDFRPRPGALSAGREGIRQLHGDPGVRRGAPGKAARQRVDPPANVGRSGRAPAGTPATRASPNSCTPKTTKPIPISTPTLIMNKTGLMSRARILFRAKDQDQERRHRQEQHHATDQSREKIARTRRDLPSPPFHVVFPGLSGRGAARRTLGRAVVRGRLHDSAKRSRVQSQTWKRLLAEHLLFGQRRQKN